MKYVFEEGVRYEAADRNYEPIRVVKRTRRFIFVEGVYGGSKFRMKIRDGGDSEYAVDSSVPPRLRDVFTYSAKWIYE